MGYNPGEAQAKWLATFMMSGFFFYLTRQEIYDSAETYDSLEMCETKT